MEGKIEEGLVKGAKPSKLLKDTNLQYMKDYICRISGNRVGTGFFCKIKYNYNLIPVLITNYHVIDDNYIEKNKQINIYINNNMKVIKLYSDSLIYSSDITKYDIIIIKIKNDYEINKFLEIEENIFIDNAENLFKNESIYILHFPNGGEANISYGCGIEKIYEYDIMHKCNTDIGSSGGPILNEINNKVIGIHKAYDKKYSVNLGTFLKYPLNELLENIQRNEGLLINPKNQFKIFIIDPKNRKISIDLSSLSIKVKELKELIQITSDEFVLKGNGCVLRDDKTLDFYGVEDNDVIFVSGRQLGG